MDIKKNPQSTKWRRAVIVVGAVAGVLAIGAALASLSTAAPSVSSSDLWIDGVVQGDMKREIRASGKLVPKDLRWITAQATATVKRVVVQGGTTVQPDTVILELENSELLSNQKKAQSALAAAEADTAALRASLASQLMDQQAAEVQAESEWSAASVKADAHRRAYDAGILSLVELKQTEIVEKQAERKSTIEKSRVAVFRKTMAAQTSAAMARHDEARSALDVANQQVDSLQVKAGIAGVLQHVEVEEGQQVDIGAKLARVARPDDLIARLMVPEMLASGLEQGLAVAVDTRNGSVEGKIIRVDPAVREGAVTVDVSLPATLPDGARPDLSVDGRILLGTLHNVASLGRPALAAAESEGRLLVLDGDGSHAHWVQVEFGAASSDRIEIRSGLRPGQRAVLSDTSRWGDFQEIRIK